MFTSISLRNERYYKDRYNLEMKKKDIKTNYRLKKKLIKHNILNLRDIKVVICIISIAYNVISK
jgi:superfamily I DNA and/or RNA helicase